MFKKLVNEGSIFANCLNGYDFTFLNDRVIGGSSSLISESIPVDDVLEYLSKSSGILPIGYNGIILNTNNTVSLASDLIFATIKHNFTGGEVPMIVPVPILFSIIKSRVAKNKEVKPLLTKEVDGGKEMTFAINEGIDGESDILKIGMKNIFDVTIEMYCIRDIILKLEILDHHYNRFIMLNSKSNLRYKGKMLKKDTVTLILYREGKEGLLTMVKDNIYVFAAYLNEARFEELGMVLNNGSSEKKIITTVL